MSGSTVHEARSQLAGTTRRPADLAIGEQHRPEPRKVASRRAHPSVVDRSAKTVTGDLLVALGADRCPQDPAEEVGHPGPRRPLADPSEDVGLAGTVLKTPPCSRAFPSAVR